MKKDNLYIHDLYVLMDTYNKDLTYFQVPTDIFGLLKQNLPLSEAKDRILDLDYYWHNEGIATIYTVWMENPQPVWTGNCWENKHLVMITADNMRISEFALQMNTIND